MSTTTHTPSSTQIHDAHHPSEEDRPGAAVRRRGAGPVSCSDCWSPALLSAVVYGGSRYLATWTRPETSAHLTHTITRGDLVVTVTEDGNLESAKNVDIKCQVAGGSSILWIVDDGTTGQARRQARANWTPRHSRSRSTSRRSRSRKPALVKIQAEKDFARRRRFAVKEYLEGTFKKSAAGRRLRRSRSLKRICKSAQNSLAARGTHVSQGLRQQPRTGEPAVFRAAGPVGTRLRQHGQAMCS